MFSLRPAVFYQIFTFSDLRPRVSLVFTTKPNDTNYIYCSFKVLI